MRGMILPDYGVVKSNLAQKMKSGFACETAPSMIQVAVDRAGYELAHRHSCRVGQKAGSSFTVGAGVFVNFCQQ